MKIAVIGAGVTGVATAHELAVLGHDVSVFEHRASVAAEGSFALPGQAASVSPLPWAAPGLPRRRGRAWLQRHGDLHAGLGDVLRGAPWLARQLLAQRSGAPAYARRHAALQALAQLSSERLSQLTQAHDLSYERREGGLLLLSQPAQRKAVEAALARQPAQAPSWQVLGADEARALEPDLSEAWPLLAALRLPGGVVGNARLLAQGLKALAQQHGAVFRFGVEVRALRPAAAGAGVALQLAGETGAEGFDQVVICAGPASKALLRSAGLRLPLISAWAHALTAPLRLLEGQEGLRGPKVGVIDSASGIAIARLGQRLRVTGLQQLGGSPSRLDPGITKRLYAALESSYPGCAVLREAAAWKGLRSRAPDGLPLVGSTQLPGLWLNSGHGGHGWALACGAARALALAISQQPLHVPMDCFAPTRWR